MPHHCAVPMCTSNSKTSPGLSFHGFPRDPVLKATWLRSIRRDEASGCFQVNSSARVCSLHFLESDYHGSGRQRNRQTSRQNSFLKRDSVPTKFDCFPERLRRPADQGANKRKAPTERLEPPPKKRKNTSKGKASEPSQGSTADSNETNLDVSASSPAPSAPDRHNDSDGVDHHSSPSHGGSSEKSGDQHNHCHCVDKLLDELEKLDLDWKKECQANLMLCYSRSWRRRRNVWISV